MSGNQPIIKVKQKRSHPESELQCSCVRWFDYQYPKKKLLLFAVPNGGARNSREAAIMQGEGVRAGVADMFLAVPFKEGMDSRSDELSNGLFIEFKVGVNKQTPRQVAFEKAVIAEGYQYRVIKSFDEFKKMIEQYLRKREIY